MYKMYKARLISSSVFIYTWVYCQKLEVEKIYQAPKRFQLGGGGAVKTADKTADKTRPKNTSPQ